LISHSKPFLDAREKQVLAELVDSNMLSQGERTAELEQTITSNTGYYGSVAVSSASIGIYIILKYRFPAGKGKIALSSYLCRSIWDAVKMADCIPVLYDIDPLTFAIDEEVIEREKVDLVIVAHMFGIRAHFEKLTESGIEVIEDCAQRITPTFIKNEPRARWRVYSFDPTKLLTCGQGGLISGTEAEEVNQIRKMLKGDYDYPYDCIKAPFSDLQASLALVQWKKLDHFLQIRKKTAQYYIETLVAHNLGFLIHEAMFREDTWHFRFIVQVNSPELFINKMAGKGIACRKPVHPFGLHTLFGYKGSFRQTEKANDHLLSLPLYPALTEKEQAKIISSFIDIYE
jgi:dTDP-4-amino-4,6-dideoxygalactose transaminase